MTNLATTDQTKIDDWKAKVDAKLDAKIMTYDETTNNYVYRNKYVSRDDVGTGDGQITLEKFQTAVDKMLLSNDNDFSTTTSRTSLDGTVNTQIKDLTWNR